MHESGGELFRLFIIFCVSDHKLTFFALFQILGVHWTMKRVDPYGRIMMFFVFFVSFCFGYGLFEFVFYLSFPFPPPFSYIHFSVYVNLLFINSKIAIFSLRLCFVRSRYYVSSTDTS